MPQHHAVLLLGRNLPEAGFDVNKLSLETELEQYTYEVLSISNVRQILDRAYVRPMEHASKTIVVAAGSIALEAQNALLKVLEEPPLTTKFVLLLPSLQGLIPTLLSRLYRPLDTNVVAVATSDNFTFFQSASIATRLETITSITKNKDTVHINDICSGVKIWVSKNSKFIKAGDLVWATDTLGSRGASKKMLLEEIAFLLPLQS
jgi:hypothetical protein